MLLRQRGIGARPLKALLSAAFFLVLLTGSSVTRAAETLMFVTGPDYQPYVDEAVPTGGIATQILREALATQGRQLHIDFLPWRRGWQLMMEGTYTGTFPYAITPERSAEVLFSDTLIMVRTYVYYPPDTPSWWFGPQSAAGKTFCRPDGWSDPPALTMGEVSKQITRTTAADLGGCLRMLAAKRVDFFIADAAIVGRNLTQEAGSLTVQRGPLITEVPLVIAVSKALGDGEAVVAMINRGLSALSASGRLEQIRGYP